ncbi:unnamed protein product [Rhodiola kirilowii]
MGANGSKECGGDGEAGQSSASNSIAMRARRFRGSSVFGSSCIRLACRSGDSADSIQIPRHRNKEQVLDVKFADPKGCESHHENTQGCRKVGAEQPFDFGVQEWTESRGHDISDAQNQSENHSRSLLSRFNLFPSSLSFRMGRATGAGSSRDDTSPTDFINSETEEDINEGNASRPVALTNGCVNIPEPGSYTRDIVRNDGSRYDISVPALTNYVDTGSTNPQPAEIRNGNREPIEPNVRFSRSLSVGRLRDRVLRRSSASDSTVLPLRQDEEVINVSSNRVPHDAENSSISRGNNIITSAIPSISPRSNIHSDVAIGQDYEAGSSLPRETRFHNVLEHRSNFLERRRRIRSQVRALQRLGNRFENLSGHERSCIMSGHHRTGRCACRVGIRVGNSNDESTARGSISRIVMLAEALFEVLDEMHQQSVVLSSQPSISSIGSVAAPSEVVESLPVKLHSKLQIHHSDDVAQCYVCLLEYEEGDKIRVLPCHHEFHKTCIDKWLKEIHRVCPLCRGDICRPGTSHHESQI